MLFLHSLRFLFACLCLVRTEEVLTHLTTLFLVCLLGGPRKCEDWCNDSFLDSSLSHVSGMQVVESFIITSWLGGSLLSLSSPPFQAHDLLLALGSILFMSCPLYPDLRLLSWSKLEYFSGLIALFASGINLSSLALIGEWWFSCCMLLLCLLKATHADPYVDTCSSDFSTSSTYKVHACFQCELYMSNIEGRYMFLSLFSAQVQYISCSL